MIVVGSFVFVYTPGFIVYTFNELPGKYALPELHVAVYLLGFSHAFINPVIYIYFNGFYRKEFCRILKIKGNSDLDTSISNDRRPVKQKENTSQTTV